MKRAGLALTGCVLALWLPALSAGEPGATPIDAPRLSRPQAASELPATSPFVLPPLDGSAPVLIPGSSALFDAVDFRGNTVYSADELEQIVTPYLRRQLGEADLEDLRQKLTLHYIDHGYINSGALIEPPGPDRPGLLRIRLVEGRLSQVRIHGLERLDEDYVVSRLVPHPEAPFNMDEVRARFQLLLADPLFTRISARLVPDSQPGLATLELEVERARPYQLSIFVNNHRPPSIGSDGRGLNGSFRNVLGIGDLLTAGWQESTRGGDSGRRSFSWNVPVNRHGTSAYVQLDRGRSAVVEEPLARLDIRSFLDSRELGLGQLLHESLKHRIAIGISYASRVSTTSLLGAPFSFVAGVREGEIKALTAKSYQEYAYRTEVQALTLRSTFGRTSDNLEAAADPTQPAGRYGFWLGQAQYLRKLSDEGIQLITRASTQATRARVLSLDAMAIGGVHTVRGYRENELLRDQGQIINVELAMPFGRAGSAALPSLSIGPFYDWGRGQNIAQPATIISSTGIAARLEWQGLRLEIAVAHRLHRPPSVDSQTGTLQDKRIHLQLSYTPF